MKPNLKSQILAAIIIAPFYFLFIQLFTETNIFVSIIIYVIFIYLNMCLIDYIHQKANKTAKKNE